MSKRQSYVPALSYHFLTPLYDTVVSWTSRERVFKSELIQQFGPHPVGDILDLACGTGTLTIALKRAFPASNVYGVDGDAKILGYAKRKSVDAGVHVAYQVGLSFELPYADESFGSVVSSLFFHHLTPESKRETLAEIRRVLRPSGSVHIADWGKASNLVMKMASLPVQWLDGATSKDSYQGGLPSLLSAAGFREVSEAGSFDSFFGTIRLHNAVKG